VTHLQNEAPLTDDDKAHLLRFELGNLRGGQDGGFANNIQDEEATRAEEGGSCCAQESMKRQFESQLFLDMTKLPITSNIVERFFSQVKLTLTYLCNSLLPCILEIIMLLKMNAESMTKMTVQVASE
jgi:hypothetical protein